jgi:hypothetical protein
LLDDRRIRNRSQIREAQKYVDPVDPNSDPEHWNKHELFTSLDMVEIGRSRAAPTDTAREKEQHHTDI